MNNNSRRQMRTPKGRIMIIGGAEQREKRRLPAAAEANRDSIPFEVLKQLLPVRDNRKPIKITDTALEDPSGLGFLDNCIIDTHFMKRNRFGRLTQTILQNPTCVGTGLGEDTALIVSKGNNMECVGSGMVVIIDATRIKYSNILNAESNTHLSVEGLTVHILSRGNGFKLKERKFIPEVK